MRGIGELLSRVTLPSIGEARPSPLVTIGDRIGEARPRLRVSRGLLPWLPSLNPDPEDRPHHRNDGMEPEPEHQRAVSGVHPRPSKSAMTPPSATRVADGRDNAAERRNPAPGCLAWAKGGAQLEAAAAVATGEVVAAATATAEVAEAEAAAEAVTEAEAAAARCRLTGAESRLLEGAKPVVQIPLSATDVSTCSERAPDRLSLTEESAEPEPWPELGRLMVTLEPTVVCVRPPVPGCACV